MNPRYSSEETSMLKQIEVDKIKLLGNPISLSKDEPEKDYGNILSTKFHRTFDGSVHVSIKLPSSASGKSVPSFGVFFR